MSTPPWGKISRRSLMENITLLKILKEVPGPEKENDLPKGFNHVRQLSIEREKIVVDNLAFLSAITDDPCKVMAVCIEEDPDLNGLIIRLATNTGHLQEVCQGFEGIARVLEQAASRANSREDDVESLLQLVVTLDYPRILTRLRSRHAESLKRSKSQRPCIVQLREAVYDKSIGQKGFVSQKDLEDIRSRVNDLEKLFLSFEDVWNRPQELLTAREFLINILKQAHELVSQTNISATLGTSLKLDPSLKKHLPKAIGKIGQYYSASYELVRAASSSRYRVFHRISVEAIQIPRPNPIMDLDQSSTLANVLRTISRPANRDGQEQTRRSLEAYMAKPLAKAQREFQFLMSEHNENAKVHAEIQILFFYELHAELPRPRVICSSKSACYLCNLFVSRHGKFYMPRTHGRLYGAWTLPNIPTNISETCRRGLNLLTEQFNSELKNEIRVVLSNARIPFYHPNESVLVPAAHWSSSTLSKAFNPLDSTPTLRLEQIEDQPLDQDPVASPALVSVSKSVSRASSSGTIRDSCQTFPQGKSLTAMTSPISAKHSLLQFSSRVIDTQTGVPEPASSSSSQLAVTRAASPAAPRFQTSRSVSKIPLALGTCLERGQRGWLELFDPDHSVLIETDNLHLTLSREYAIDHIEPDLASCRKYGVQVRSLDPTEQVRITTDGSEVVNIDGMDDAEGVTLEHGGFDTSAELYVRHGETVVGIKYTCAS